MSLDRHVSDVVEAKSVSPGVKMQRRRLSNVKLERMARQKDERRGRVGDASREDVVRNDTMILALLPEAIGGLLPRYSSDTHTRARATTDTLQNV